MECGALSFFGGKDVLYPADDPAGEKDGEQRVDQPLPRDIGQGEGKDGKVADKIDLMDLQRGHMGHAHGQGVVPVEGAPRPDAEAHAHAHENCPQNGGP